MVTSTSIGNFKPKSMSVNVNATKRVNLGEHINSISKSKGRPKIRYKDNTGGWRSVKTGKRVKTPYKRKATSYAMLNRALKMGVAANKMCRLNGAAITGKRKGLIRLLNGFDGKVTVVTWVFPLRFESSAAYYAWCKSDALVFLEALRKCLARLGKEGGPSKWVGSVEAHPDLTDDGLTYGKLHLLLVGNGDLKSCKKALKLVSKGMATFGKGYDLTVKRPRSRSQRLRAAKWSTFDAKRAAAYLCKDDYRVRDLRALAGRHKWKYRQGLAGNKLSDLVLGFGNLPMESVVLTHRSAKSRLVK